MSTRNHFRQHSRHYSLREAIVLASTTSRRELLQAITSYLIAQWLIFGLALVILLAWAFPSVGKNGGPIRAEYTVKWGAVVLIFLLTGYGLSSKELVNQVLNWHLHIVTQVISFFVFSVVVYGTVWAIVASGNTHLDRVVLSGLITMSVLPTTCNVAMTRDAGGSVEAATAEVLIGNVIGTFLAPALLVLYLKPLQSNGFLQPYVSYAGGLMPFYTEMAKQLSACIVAPLIVGQVLQHLSATRAERIRERFKFGIMTQVLLLVLVWTIFCNQFATRIFSRVSKETIILVTFLNVVLYFFMSLVCFWTARPPFTSRKASMSPLFGGDSKEAGAMATLRRLVEQATFDKRETAAICYCGAEKGLVLGGPLISVFCSTYGEETQAAVMVPIVLYQGTQVVAAQLSVIIVRRWISQGENSSSERRAQKGV